MIITKWLKKYNITDYRFVTFENGNQALIVDDDDALNPIDVRTGKNVDCFGHEYIVKLTDCVKLKDSKISLLKAKKIAKHNDLYKKYKLFVEKVKEVEQSTGVKY